MRTKLSAGYVPPTPLYSVLPGHQRPLPGTAGCQNQPRTLPRHPCHGKDPNQVQCTFLYSDVIDLTPVEIWMDATESAYNLALLEAAAAVCPREHRARGAGHRTAVYELPEHGRHCGVQALHGPGSCSHRGRTDSGGCVPGASHHRVVRRLTIPLIRSPLPPPPTPLRTEGTSP
jgi:hypothetical protein